MDKRNTMKERIRIKDIAIRAGVSVGTVDRVLHDRPNVSKQARTKVEKALKEVNYQPNMYASALAYNKAYTFYCLLPSNQYETYWEEIEHGIRRAVDFRRDFHVKVVTLYYQRFNNDSFQEQCTQCLEACPDGVIMVPTELETSMPFAEKLKERNIPLILLDSYIQELEPLAFFGQDSFHSGCFAAKMLMLIARGQKRIMLFKQTMHGRVSSRQQSNREIGLRNYLNENHPEVDIVELDIPIEEDRSRYDELMEKFFLANPDIKHCITLSSKAHIVGDFLLRTNRKDVQIMGYDIVEKNAKCMNKGSISFLIAQHAYMQGFYCVDALVKHKILKKQIEQKNYMPIELISKENIAFYHRECI